MGDLRRRLVAAGCTQNALAHRAGVHPAHLSRWLNFRVIPSMETMVTLDEAMDQLESHTIPTDY